MVGQHRIHDAPPNGRRRCRLAPSAWERTRSRARSDRKKDRDRGEHVESGAREGRGGHEAWQNDNERKCHPPARRLHDCRQQLVKGFSFILNWTPGRSFYRSEEHTSELQSLMRISYAVLCLKKQNNK